MRREPLLPNHVHVWYRLTESLDMDAVARSLARLSAEERSRHDRHRRPQERRDFAVAHALLRWSLSRYDNGEPDQWTFSTTWGGKPSIASPARARARLTFSLSHTRGCVACAIAPGADVGVDVERTDLRFDFRSVASRYFDANERAQLERTPEHERAARFVDIWTLKEARGKATGRGIGDTETNTAGWQCAMFSVDAQYRLAVAVASRGGQPWTIMARNIDTEEATDGHRPL